MLRARHRSLMNGGILSGRMPLISLVQFITVAEHLNFQHVANALGVSQSSVQHHATKRSASISRA